MRRRLTAFCVAPVLVAALLTLQAAPPQSAANAGAIRPEAIRAHMRFLADDLLEGRATGTRGYDLAAAYVASQMEAFGLEPAGGDGTYFQQVPLRRSFVVAEGCEGSILGPDGEKPLKMAEDFIVSSNPAEAEASVEAPVVFVGYGISAPKFGHDDYAGVDVKGKIVALMGGAPQSLPGTARAHFSSGGQKARTAAERGAVGIITLRAVEADQRQPLSRMARFLRAPATRWLDPSGRPNNTWPHMKATATFSGASSEALFAGAPMKLAEAMAAVREGKSKSFPLARGVRLKVTSRHEDLKSPNVAGLVRGSDPKLRDEYVVFTAHLDHVGIGREINGDSIYNGAVDNASGVAALLESARAWTALPQRPRRSMVFVAVTAEEVGLLGSDYYANLPTVPAENIVANVNVDCIGAFYPLHDIVALGGEHSTIGDVAARVGQQMGLALSADPMPEQNFFTRSDHYSFVRRGVPAMVCFAGLNSGDSDKSGDAIFREWLRTIYHRPSDDIRQTYDFTAAARFTEFHFRVALEVAQATERPSWKPGDFFGDTFGRRAASQDQ